MGSLIWFCLCVCSTIWIAVNDAAWYWIALNVFLDLLALKSAIKALSER
jgi:hypothetical protein